MPYVQKYIVAHWRHRQMAARTGLMTSLALKSSSPATLDFSCTVPYSVIAQKTAFGTAWKPYASVSLFK